MALLVKFTFLILTVMKTKLFTLLVSLIYLSCDDKRNYSPDFEYAHITIITKEDCRLNDNENAWIINVSPYGGKSFGVPITYQGREFKNAVKVYNYNFQKEFADSTFKYSADFYSEIVSGKPCEVSNPTIFNVPTIRIKAVVRTQ